MSRIFCCPKCRKGWHLVGEHDEVLSIVSIIHSESNTFECITPLCTGRLVEVSGAPVGFTIKELPARAFYRAIHGFGAGAGDPAAHKDFVELIKNGKVVAVDADPVGQPERVILRQLVFEDGTRMHFDSSSRGACCYYIERPGKSCVEVVEDELSSDETTVRRSDSHREEAGRSDADTASEQGPEQRAGVPSDAAAPTTGPTPMRPVQQDSDIPENQRAVPRRNSRNG